MLKLIYIISWWLQCRFAKKQIPLKSVIEVENQPYQHIIDRLKYCCKAGSRWISFKGTPMLWTDGRHDVNDLVSVAKKIGFLSVTIHADGLTPLKIDADVICLPLNKLDEAEIISNIANSLSKNIRIIMTINKANYNEIENMAKFAAGNPQIKSVEFNFYRPCEPDPELELSSELQYLILDKLQELKKNSFPVHNSSCAIALMRKEEFKRQGWVTNYIDKNGNRYNSCSDNNQHDSAPCNFADAAEMACIFNFNPETIAELVNS